MSKLILVITGLCLTTLLLAKDSGSPGNQPQRQQPRQLNQQNNRMNIANYKGIQMFSGKTGDLIMNFYKDPSTEKIIQIINELNNAEPGFVTSRNYAIGTFLGEAFSKFHKNLPDLTKLETNNSVQNVILYGLKAADTNETRVAFKALTQKIGRSASDPEILSVTNVRTKNYSNDVIEGCWGGFFGSGDKKYVRQIVEIGVPTNSHDLPPVRSAALASLLALYPEHPIVKKLLREGLQGLDDTTEYYLSHHLTEDQQRDLLDRVITKSNKQNNSRSKSYYNNNNNSNKKSKSNNHSGNNTLTPSN